MQKVVVFDFDGTIADIMAVAPKVANDVFRAIGEPELSWEEMAEYREYSIPQAIKKIGIPAWKIPKGISEVRKSLHAIRDEIELIDGMGALIAELADNSDVQAIYILTSNSAENVQTLLKANKLTKYVDEVVSSLNLFNKPGKLKSLLARHGHTANETYMVGDESRDIDAGNKVGTRTIAVSWGINTQARLERAKPDHFVNTIDELRKVLE